jgi:hypothetical protein
MEPTNLGFTTTQLTLGFLVLVPGVDCVSNELRQNRERGYAPHQGDNQVPARTPHEHSCTVSGGTTSSTSGHLTAFCLLGVPNA